MMRRAFSLIELLVVIAIIAILSAILFPVFVTAKNAAYQLVGVSNIRGLGGSLALYATDNDETFMPAMGMDERGFWAWFGRPTRTAADESEALLAPYRGKRKLVDPALPPRKNYLGDGSGFGYNWGYVGSDMHAAHREFEYPYCYYPAKQSDLGHPATTVTFATSGYYSAKWEGGDGGDYDFGFIDPVGVRPLNPNVSFHYMTPRRVDGGRVVSKGHALVVFADGHARPAGQGAMKDDWFTRGDPLPEAAAE